VIYLCSFFEENRFVLRFNWILLSLFQRNRNKCIILNSYKLHILFSGKKGFYLEVGRNLYDSLSNFRRNATLSCCSTQCWSQINRFFAILPNAIFSHRSSFLLRKSTTNDGDGLGDFGEKKRALIVTFGAVATVRSNTSECTSACVHTLRALLRNVLRMNCVTICTRHVYRTRRLRLWSWSSRGPLKLMVSHRVHIALWFIWGK